MCLAHPDSQAFMFDFDLAKVGIPQDGGEFPDKAGIEAVFCGAHQIACPQAFNLSAASSATS